MAEYARMTPAALRCLKLRFEGLGIDQAAAALGVSRHQVVAYQKQVRLWLQERGHRDVGNVILLRKAMRQEHLIDDLEPI